MTIWGALIDTLHYKVFYLLTYLFAYLLEVKKERMGETIKTIIMNSESIKTRHHLRVFVGDVLCLLTQCVCTFIFIVSPISFLSGCPVAV